MAEGAAGFTNPDTATVQCSSVLWLFCTAFLSSSTGQCTVSTHTEVINAECFGRKGSVLLLALFHPPFQLCGVEEAHTYRKSSFTIGEIQVRRCVQAGEVKEKSTWTQALRKYTLNLAEQSAETKLPWLIAENKDKCMDMRLQTLWIFCNML